MPAWTCLSNWSLHYLPQIVKFLPLPLWAWSSCEKDEDISWNVLITPYLQIAPSLLYVTLIHKLSTHFLSLHSFLTQYSFSLLITFSAHAAWFSFSRSFCLSQFFLSISPKCSVITEPSLHVAVYILQLASSSWFKTGTEGLDIIHFTFFKTVVQSWLCFKFQISH